MHHRVTLKHSQLLCKRVPVVKLCLPLHWWSEFVWAERNRSGAGRKVTWVERSRERRSQKWALARSGKTARSNALLSDSDLWLWGALGPNILWGPISHIYRCTYGLKSGWTEWGAEVGIVPSRAKAGSWNVHRPKAPRIETPQASGGGEWLGVSPPQGGVSPPQPTRGSGESRKLP